MKTDQRKTTLFSIVTYEAPEYFDVLMRNLDWVKEHPEIKVVVFDNSDSNKIKEVFEKYQTNFKYIKSDKNLGYGKSHNFIWEYGKKSYDLTNILILNPDIILSEDTYLHLSTILTNNPMCAISAPQIVNEKGDIEPSVFTDPSGLSYFFDFTKQLFSKENNKRFGVTIPTHLSEVKGVSGACFLLKADSINESYIFDPDFFMYYEDLDLSKRIRKDGWKIIYSPEVQIVHSLGRSSEDFSEKELWIKEMMYRSLKLYFDKNKGLIDRFFLNLSLWTALQLRILLNKDKEWALKMYDELYR